MPRHILPIRIYHQDTDAGGRVYHANYFKFFERARVEAWRDQGIDLVSLYSKYQVHFVVQSANLKFLQAARLDQLLYVVTEVRELRQASILFHQALHLETPEGPLLCQADIKLACVNANDRPAKLPHSVIEAIMKEAKQ